MHFYFGSSFPSSSDLAKIFTTFKLCHPTSASLLMNPKPCLKLVKTDGQSFSFFGPIQTLEEVYNRII